MNNTDVLQILDECQNDLDRVRTIIESLGATSLVVPYLTKYAIIKACGTIETVYKTIIADYCSMRSKKQVKYFLRKRVRDSSNNPSYQNICQMLGNFDEDWTRTFKDRINTHPDHDIFLTSMKSLVDARNDFAHGGNPGLTISDTITYFGHFRTIIVILDDIVS